MKSLWLFLCIALWTTAGCGYRGALQLPEATPVAPAAPEGPAEYNSPAAQ